MAEPIGFYVTGGAMPRDARSYVTRRADREILECLRDGLFCYVLTPRQMGKSSLMVRAAGHLRAEGAAVAVLDLTALGYHGNPETWYRSFVSRMGTEFKLEREVDGYWHGHPDLSPVERWAGALRDVVLEWRPGRVVLFLDEIDSVRALGFSADDLFASIRACYNRRPEDPAFERLTFCLLGVAAPSDLIRNPHVTPFNIGRRIELTDFTPEEAAPLAEGLIPQPPPGGAFKQVHTSAKSCGPEGGEKVPPLRGLGGPEHLLQRILHWTGGHPYLTQRLCQAVVESTDAWSRSRSPIQAVDALCRDLFLRPQLRLQDDNLHFVQERLLRCDADPAALLDLYRRILKRGIVQDGESRSLVAQLKLSGIVRSVRGYLQIRNRIYGRAFGLRWIRENMPDAERRRQRSAYLAGMLRSASLASVVLLAVSAAAFVSIRSARDAARSLKEKEQALYAADMAGAGLAMGGGNYGRAEELLNTIEAESGLSRLRGFEWRYLRRQLQRDIATLPADTSLIYCVSVSPDAQLLATGSQDGTVRVWNLPGRRLLYKMKCHSGGVTAVGFSPNGKWIASAGDDGRLALTDVASQAEVVSTEVSRRAITSLAFSPDGASIATGDSGGQVDIWKIGGKLSRRLQLDPRRNLGAPCFAPDGKRIACCSGSSARVYDALSGTYQAAYPIRGGMPFSLAFTPDGKRMLAGTAEGDLLAWNTAARRLEFRMRLHAERIAALSVSPDGRMVATASWDQTVGITDIRTGAMQRLIGHTDRVNSLAFYDHGQRLATSAGPDVKLWDVSRPAAAALVPWFKNAGSYEIHCSGGTVAAGLRSGGLLMRAPDAGSRPVFLRTRRAETWAVGLCKERHLLAIGMGNASAPDDGEIEVRDLRSGIAATTLRCGERVDAVAIAPGGKLLAAALGQGRRIRLWRLPSGKPAGSLIAGDYSATESLAFSPDGTRLVAGTWSRTVCVWDVGSLRSVRTFRAHPAAVWSVAFSPDGKTLATGSQDGTIKLWNMSTLQEMLSLEVSADAHAEARNLTFAGGELLVAEDSRHVLHQWRTD